MEPFTTSRDMELDESERSPNRYTARAMLWTLLTLLVACIFNEIGIFDVDRTTLLYCFALSAVLCCLAYFLSRSEKTAVHPKTKYILLSLAFVMTLAIMVFFNINTTLMVLLPVFLATQYRSMKVTALAILDSCLCCILYPILAWVAHAWSVNIILGYLETAGRVTVLGLGGPSTTLEETLFNLLVYVSLPQTMVVLVFGAVILGVTQSSIRGMHSRAQVMDLSESLSAQLEQTAYMQDQILYAMADIVENRDLATGGHVKRTSEVVRLLVNAMREDPDRRLSDEFCDMVIKAAPLHDLGKIAVDDAILRKPGPLTPEERAVINLHPAKGAEIIRNVLGGIEDEDFLRIAANLAMYHHEWYNGTGYPEKRRGEDIPLEARLMAIADVYDALVSKRSYKAAMPAEEAFRIIEDAMGDQFDPALNKYFLQVRPEIEAYYFES